MPAPDRIEIVIRFDPAHGHEEAALLYARRLFAVLDEAIDALSLLPFDGGDLTVELNGCLVYAWGEAGRGPRVADVTGGLGFTLPASE